MRLALICTAFFLVPLASGQSADGPSRSSDPPSAPSAISAPAAIGKPAEPSLTPHRFWDRENVLLFSGVAAFRALDFASTKNFLARGRTEVLIPDDIVNNNAGFASLEAAATMTSVGISYAFHRTGHHKMERWVSIVHMSVTAFGDAHNYALKSKHP